MRVRYLAAVAALILTVSTGRAAVVAIDDAAGPGAMNAVADMVAVPDYAGALFDDIGGLALPAPYAPGTLTFSNDHNVREIGAGWATWSHGYTGRVYYSNGATDVSYALPSGISAFDFYIEPNPFALIEITATSASGTVLSQTVNGDAGAKYFGFYGNASESITSVQVTSTADWAIAEFRVGTFRQGQGPAPTIPEPGSMALLAGGLVAVLRRRKRA